MGNIMEKLELTAQSMYCKKIEELTPAELHYSLGKAVMGEIAGNWEASKIKHDSERRAYYFSAEFLMGRMMYNNLYCLGILEDVTKLLKKKGIDINVFEDIDDAALGNGGLGRLAACFLDSAATQEVPLDGYGIRYKYGLFKQLIENGYQVETADNWQRFEDPWCNRVEDEAVTVSFKGQTVKAVPYDMAVIGCKTTNINTLRLWQAEAINDFDFTAFNNTEYNNAVRKRMMLKTSQRFFILTITSMRARFSDLNSSISSVLHHFRTLCAVIRRSTAMISASLLRKTQFSLTIHILYHVFPSL